MIGNYLLAIGLILLLLAGWVTVQQLARAFARRYPQFGPARQEGGGCGKGCLCGAGKCQAKKR